MGSLSGGESFENSLIHELANPLRFLDEPLQNDLDLETVDWLKKDELQKDEANRYFIAMMKTFFLKRLILLSTYDWSSTVKKRKH